MYDPKIPLPSLGLGTNPAADLHILAQYLAYWRDQERGKQYGDFPHLEALAPVALALAEMLRASAGRIDPEEYAAAHIRIREDDEIHVTQSLLESEKDDP